MDVLFSDGGGQAEPRERGWGCVHGNRRRVECGLGMRPLCYLSLEYNCGRTTIVTAMLLSCCVSFISSIQFRMSEGRVGKIMQDVKSDGCEGRVLGEGRGWGGDRYWCW